MFEAKGGEQTYDTRDFPLNEEEWAMYGDFNIPSLSWEANKRLLKRANEDYNLGITNPEYYTIDPATAEANFYAGKTYAYGAYMAPSMPLLDNFYSQNPDAELAVYTFVGEEQKTPEDPGTGYYPLYRADYPVGMTIGLMPVMGIPLPYISYGGSSLIAFTIMLFIAVRLDASMRRFSLKNY